MKKKKTKIPPQYLSKMGSAFEEELLKFALGWDKPIEHVHGGTYIDPSQRRGGHDFTRAGTFQTRLSGSSSINRRSMRTPDAKAATPKPKLKPKKKILMRRR